VTADEQAALVAWIWGQPGALPPHGMQASERGLNAYREHAKALAVRALAAVFPRLQTWMGEGDFAGLAWAFARTHPPRAGDMNRWGGELSAFLCGLPGMDEEPPALAAFEWALHCMAFAADDGPADEALWQQLQLTDPGHLRLRFATGIALHHLPVSLDAMLSAGAEETGGGPLWLVWRSGWRPAWTPFAEAQQNVLAALLCEPTLAAALQAQPAEAPLLAAVLQQGWRQGWLLGAQRA